MLKAQKYQLPFSSIARAYCAAMSFVELEGVEHTKEDLLFKTEHLTRGIKHVAIHVSGLNADISSEREIIDILCKTYRQVSDQ